MKSFVSVPLNLNIYFAGIHNNYFLKDHSLYYILINHICYGIGIPESIIDYFQIAGLK